MNREMKHSGIEWIGEIPKEWKTQKFKTITKSMKSGGTPTSSNAAFYNENGTPWVAIGDMRHCGEIFETQKHLTEEGLKDKSLEIYPCGTLLYSIYASVGKVSVLKIPAAINQAILALSLNEKAINGYGKYLLVSMEDYVFSLANGNTQFNLNGGIVANLNIPLPPLSEQQKIANYLDKVCGEVDEMIALQEQMIEELKAYKQSVITEAVTKGLNPDVPMRDSGIEWIGEVPEHWEVKKLKYLSNVVRGGSPRPAGDTRYYEGNIPFMKVADITKDEKIYVDSCEYSIKEAGLPHTRTIMPGTLLLTNSGATLGVPKINTFKTTFNDGIAAFLNIDKNLDLIFAYYSLKARTKLFLDSASLGIGQPNLNTEIIGNTPLLLPPLTEQQSIASYLDTKCAEIDALIAIKQAKKDSLMDYKKSVIYEYVTGKKEVI